MNGSNDPNDIRRLEGHAPIPNGFLVFLLVLVAWGAWYLWTYTPAFSGWSAYKELAAEEARRVGDRGNEAPGASPGAADTAAQAEGNSFAGNAAAAREGEEIFEKECAGCHGKHMKDPSGGPDLLGTLTYGSAEADLFLTVSKGRPGGMPDFGGSLGTERIRKVVAYLLRERGGKKGSGGAAG